MGPVPQWVAILEMAEAWSIPPWEVEERTPLLWANRFALYRKAQYYARTDDERVFE